jgi:heme-degrading monooxygenase HmoA
MKSFFVFLVLVISLPLCAQQDSVSGATPRYQLRIYELERTNREAFHQRFQQHAHRIMKNYGFNILAMWEAEQNGKLEFVYLLVWKNDAQLKSAWEKFMADEEWKAIKAETAKQHGVFVHHIDDRILDSLPGVPVQLRH